MIVNNGTPKANHLAQIFSEQISLDFLKEQNCIVVIGGDGFFLETVNRYGLDYKYLPINAGSLGFLLNDYDRNTIAKVQSQNWNMNYFFTLDATMVDSYAENAAMADAFSFQQDELIGDVAVNDVCLERMTSQTTRLDVAIDGETVVENLAADGLIISTSLGSTGYNFSAGGSICHPVNPVMSITPICAHRPKLPPIVIPISSKVWIRANERNKRPVKATIDGREYPDVGAAVISGGSALKILYLEGHNFTKQLVKKILK